MTNTSLPWLTKNCPGLGGILKQVPEDFVVEEIPAYEPAGAGEHLFLWIEKRDVSAEQLLQHLARRLGIPRSEIGMAGMKDRRAVTRQYVSVSSRSEEKLANVETENIRVLRTSLHGNKLKAGHLRGNRFSILVRDVPADASFHAAAIAERIQAVGFPNYFGDQRFGHDRGTLETGLALLRGEQTERDIPKSRRKFLLRLSLSAVQSELFNQSLAYRLEQDLIDRVLAGDVMQVTASGGVFVVEDPDQEQARLITGEIVTTGPLFGPKMRRPTGDVAKHEEHILLQSGLNLDHFRKFPKLTPGGRRPYLVRPGELQIQSEQEGLRFEFILPAGVYATILLREFRTFPPSAGESGSVDSPG